MGSIQNEIKYLKRAAKILIFKLQTHMNQIFQMRYYKNFNENLYKAIGCPSSQSKNCSRPFGFEATFLQVVY